jgi:hypothetical protein
MPSSGSHGIVFMDIMVNGKDQWIIRTESFEVFWPILRAFMFIASTHILFKLMCLWQSFHLQLTYVRRTLFSTVVI